MFLRYSFMFLLLTTAPLFSAIDQKPESEKTFFSLKASDFFVTHSYFNPPSSAQIAILGNIHNNDKYIIKQKTIDRVFTCVIREKIVADMAEKMTEKIGIYANKVIIVPAHCPFPGKYDLEKPASLIAFVPGTVVCNLPEHYHKPNLKQANNPKRIRGLQKEMINDMARHPDLPILVAFDTFTGHNDRHPENLFYDEKSDHYFAIDLESGFYNNIAEHAHALFEQMIKDKKQKEEKEEEEEKKEKKANLSTEEINALTAYQSTLKTLIPIYPPEIIFSKIAQSRIEAGIEDHEESGKMEEALQQTIQDNYDSCKLVVASLDALLKMYTPEEGTRKT